MKLDSHMGGHGRKIPFTPTPDDGVIYPRAADTQDKIARGHVHILDDLVRGPVDHVPESGHMTHSGPEFQVTFFFDIDTSLFVHAVRFPDRGVFHRMVVTNGESFTHVKRDDQKGLAALYRGYAEFQSAGKQHTRHYQEDQAGRSQKDCF